MISTLTIDDRQIRLKATAATPFKYKRYFNRDFFRDLFTLGKSLSKSQETQDITSMSYEDIERMDLDTTYRIAWVFAKEATPELPDFEEWLSTFDSLSIADLMTACGPMITGLMKSKKPKNTYKKKRQKKKKS